MILLWLLIFGFSQSEGVPLKSIIGTTAGIKSTFNALADDVATISFNPCTVSFYETIDRMKSQASSNKVSVSIEYLRYTPSLRSIRDEVEDENEKWRTITPSWKDFNVSFVLQTFNFVVRVKMRENVGIEMGAGGYLRNRMHKYNAWIYREEYTDANFGNGSEHLTVGRSEEYYLSSVITGVYYKREKEMDWILPDLLNADLRINYFRVDYKRIELTLIGDPTRMSKSKNIESDGSSIGYDLRFELGWKFFDKFCIKGGLGYRKVSIPIKGTCQITTGENGNLIKRSVSSYKQNIDLDGLFFILGVEIL